MAIRAFFALFRSPLNTGSGTAIGIRQYAVFFFRPIACGDTGFFRPISLAAQYGLWHGYWHSPIRRVFLVAFAEGDAELGASQWQGNGAI